MPLKTATSKPIGTVFTIGHPANWNLADLFRALVRHRIGSLVDARPSSEFDMVADLRQGCVARGVTYDWQPLVGFACGSDDEDLRTSAAAVAAFSRVVVQGQRAVAGARRPCILFAGALVRKQSERHRLSKELQKRGLDVLHIVWGADDRLEAHQLEADAEVVRVGGSGEKLPSSLGSLGEPLEVEVIQPRDGSHKCTLVYLHAFGSGVARYVKDAAARQKMLFAMDGVKLLFPLAPQTHTARKVACWFDSLTDNKNLSEDDVVEQTLEESRVRLSALLDKEAKELGEGGNSKLVVGGVEQGCAMALHASLLHRLPVALFVGVCGHRLRCTPAPGRGFRLPCHFFSCSWEGTDPGAWAERTLDFLRPHHDVTMHGIPEGATTNVSPEQEAAWLRSVCDMAMKKASSGSLSKAAGGAPWSLGCSLGPGYPLAPGSPFGSGPGSGSTSPTSGLKTASGMTASSMGGTTVASGGLGSGGMAASSVGAGTMGTGGLGAGGIAPGGLGAGGIGAGGAPVGTTMGAAARPAAAPPTGPQTRPAGAALAPRGFQASVPPKSKGGWRLAPKVGTPLVTTLLKSAPPSKAQAAPMDVDPKSSPAEEPVCDLCGAAGHTAEDHEIVDDAEGEEAEDVDMGATALRTPLLITRSKHGTTAVREKSAVLVRRPSYEAAPKVPPKGAVSKGKSSASSKQALSSSPSPPSKRPPAKQRAQDAMQGGARPKYAAAQAGDALGCDGDDATMASGEAACGSEEDDCPGYRLPVVSFRSSP